MRYRAGIAVAVALAGLIPPAVGQPVDPRSDRPDPSDYLMPPVNGSSRSRSSNNDLPPRSANPADNGDDVEFRPVRRRSSDDTLKPIPPLPRDDDTLPSIRPRRPAPRYEDDAPPPRARRPVPPADERDYDELPPPRPRRSPAPPRDDYDDAPPARRPAATLAPPNGIRPVSLDQIEDSRTKGDDGRTNRRSQENIIDYLAGDRDPYAPPMPRRPTGALPTSYEPANHQHEANLFGKKVSDVLDPLAPAGEDVLKSDHSFDSFISPVSNPFLFEDPRSLTEIRPIFIYQKIPSAAPLFDGGNMYFIGAQGRLAITKRLSVVINKLGGQGIDPGSSSFYNTYFASSNNQFGLAEFWLGPKYTFIRDCENGTLLAGGLQFQIPLGSSKVYQNTGNLSIVPYATFAQNFFSTNYGSFNGLIGTGYSFSTNSLRSDYYYLSTHLDFDVHNGHRFYPLAELNWFYYTTNGTSTNFPFEGRDLVNFGSPSKGSNLMTWALGGRVKVSKSVELGGVFEGPLFGNRDLLQYRFTTDMIWRY